MTHIYNANGLILNHKTNCQIAAHRGYFVKSFQNTAASFAEAMDNGFTWVEIDIHQCSDGVYVLGHDSTVTLYNNGVATSVNLPNTEYNTIKGYTWDAAGKYPIDTLMGAWNNLKTKDLWYICDLKTGNNADLVSIASMTGMLDRIMLTYRSTALIEQERELLDKNKNIPIRIALGGYWDALISELAEIRTEIANPIYININANTAFRREEIMPLVLALNFPIVFSDCATYNKNVWCVLATGVMAEGSNNVSYLDFVDMLTNEYSGNINITVSADTASVAIGATQTLTASADADDVSGYLYVKPLNPSIATVFQRSFGNSISLEIKGISVGEATIRVFNGAGNFKDIKVVVA
jgi:glycerophosphoryl diester phosphodiesterase